MPRTAPTFVSEFETAWNSGTTPKTTASITGLTGDVIVVCGIAENNDTSLALTIANSGSALTWTLQQTVSATDFCYIRIWSTVLAGDQNFTVSVSRTNGGTSWFGANALQFRDSDGVGVSNGVTSGPTISVTTATDNSAVVVFNGDWNAVDGTTRTWETINSITPTSGNGLEVTYFRNSSHYTVYGAYYSDFGTAGTDTGGLSAPGGQKASTVYLEVLGEESGGGGGAPKTLLLLGAG